MRSNAMKQCAVGAMLFGGTLGAAQQASAGLVWNDSFTFTTVQGVYDSYGNSTYDSNGDPVLQVVQSTTNNVLQLWVQAPRSNGGSPLGNLANSLNLSDSAVMNAASISINPVYGPLATHSISKTATTASGFSMSMEYASSGGGWLSASIARLKQAFEVTAGSSVEIKLTLTAPNMGLSVVSLKKATNAGDDGYPTAEYLQDMIGGFGGIPVDPTGSVTTLTLTEGRYFFEAQYGLDSLSHTGTFVDFAIVPAPGAAALIGMAGLVSGRRRRA